MDQNITSIFKALNTLFKPSLVIERNDFATRSLEGLEQTRKVHDVTSLTGYFFLKFEFFQKYVFLNVGFQKWRFEFRDFFLAGVNFLFRENKPKSTTVEIHEIHSSEHILKFRLDLLAGQKTGK